METNIAWILIGYTGILALAIGGLAWMLGQLLNDYFSIKSRKQFEEDLVLALQNGEPTWEQIKLIAETRGVKNSDVSWVIKKLHREILTGRNEKISEKQQLINSYSELYKSEEPFEAIPDDIRLHLERVKDGIGDKSYLLEPVASHIKQLLEVKSREKKKDRIIAIVSLLIGVIGMGVGLYPYLGDSQQESKAETIKLEPANKPIKPTQ